MNIKYTQVDGGKYTVVEQEGSYPYALRYNEPWHNNLDNLHLALLHELQEALEENKRLVNSRNLPTEVFTKIKTGEYRVVPAKLSVKEDGKTYTAIQEYTDINTFIGADELYERILPNRINIDDY